MKNTILFIIAFLFSFNTYTQIFESYKDVPDGVSINGSLGLSIDSDGEWAVVGAPDESQNGAIHIYRRIGDLWVHFQKRVPPDQPDNFGRKVAIQGNVIAVASPQDETDGFQPGSVYLYKFNASTWNLVQKLLNPLDVIGGFGTDVEFSDGRLFVGSFSGSFQEEYGMFQFEEINNFWEQQHFIQLPDSFQTSCGREIEVEGNILIGNNPTDDEIAENSGSCCYFKFIDESWVYQQKIKVDNPQTFSKFGETLDLYDEKLVIGANLNDETVTNVGAVYYYELEDGLFVQKQKISPEILTEPIRLGSAISLMENKLVIGATEGLNENGINTGIAFAYGLIESQWNLLDTLINSDGISGDVFGLDVVIFEEGIIIGSIGNDEVISSGGAVYFYEDVFVGINENDIFSSLKLYPNPTNGFVHFQLPEEINEVEFSIVDINGRILKSGLLNSFNSSLDISFLSTGIYNIVFMTKEQRATRKLIVAE